MSLLRRRYHDALATSALLSCVWEPLLEFVQLLGKQHRQHFLTGLLHVCHCDKGRLAPMWVWCAVEPVGFQIVIEQFWLLRNYAILHKYL